MQIVVHVGRAIGTFTDKNDASKSVIFIIYYTHPCRKNAYVCHIAVLSIATCTCINPHHGYNISLHPPHHSTHPITPPTSHHITHLPSLHSPPITPPTSHHFTHLPSLHPPPITPPTSHHSTHLPSLHPPPITPPTSHHSTPNTESQLLSVDTVSQVKALITYGQFVFGHFLQK